MAATEIAVESPVDGDVELHDVKPLDTAGRGHISFLDNPKYLPDFKASAATACLVSRKYAASSPRDMMAIVVSNPYRAFALVLRQFYPDAMLSRTARGADWPPGLFVHPAAELEEDVSVEPGAVIGPEARIGRGTVIAAGAVVGYRVHIGRACYVGPNATVTNALIGDRVIIHAGAGIGQDGYGFAASPQGHVKIPQIGRVILQDDVEIGANTTIDRGAVRDTVVGEGTKIDNLVQIGHNVVIGRHGLIVGQVGISGSTELGDFVMIGGQSGILGHVKIGSGAQIGAVSAVSGDVPPGARWGAFLAARPIRQWGRELALLKRLIARADSARRIGDRGRGPAD